MAIESPHALILDWWHRLELAINEHFEFYGMVVQGEIPLKEKSLGADSMLGPGITLQIRGTRKGDRLPF